MTPDPVRFLVVGAGAIGGSLAAQLDRAGVPVQVVARGPHLDAIRAGGLTRVSPDGTVTSNLAAHGHVSQARLTPDTVVVMATKVHQAEVVLDDLLAHGGPDLPIVCLQNGVEGERLALRRFRRVYAGLVNVPGVHLSPGEVRLYATPARGVLDIGPYPPQEPDGMAQAISSAFVAAEFLSEATPRIMARKWAKLLGNVGNALQVLLGPDHPRLREVDRALEVEARSVLSLAGIEVDRDDQQSRAARVSRADIGDDRRPGGSTWQSVVRGHSTVETMALNGEICLLGRLHGEPTPLNDAVVARTLGLLAGGGGPGGVDPDELLAGVATHHSDLVNRSDVDDGAGLR